MGQIDEIAQQSLKHRLCAALAAAESVDEMSVRAQTLRLVKCAIDDRDTQARGSGECAGCPEAAIEELLTTMVGQRVKSAAEYDSNGRIADAEREREEIEILSEFLPRKLEGEALETAARDVVNALGARKLTDIGRCMSELRERFPGQIECGAAGKAVRRALS